MTQPDALHELVSSAQASFAQALTPADLENAKAQFLVKTGRVTELMKGMAALSVEEKKSRGAAINLAQQAIDGRRAPSALTRAVLQAVGPSADDLLAWCCAASQADFATLAPLVFDHEAHDPAAAQLLGSAVHTLERLAVAVDPEGRLPLAVWGSIGQRLAPRLAPALQARLVRPQADALQGAIQLLTQQFA